MKNNIQFIKSLRVTIHSLFNTVRERVPNSQYADAALVSLELGKMWCGKLLEAIGEATPYPNADSQNAIIEDQADSTEDLYTLQQDPVLAVKGIRSAIKTDVIAPLKDVIFGRLSLPLDVDIDIAFHEAYVHLSEARMWLGMVLHIIREQEKKAARLTDSDLAPKPL